ncbi:MAG: S8 family serine peptidase [Bacteroidota bacterium]|nr:S8 family serine peptidase [Bacteroidota bacterium]
MKNNFTRNIVLIICSVFISNFLQAQITETNTLINLRNRSFVVQQNVEKIDISNLDKFNEKYYFLIQFTKIPNEAEQNILKSKGLNLLNYISNKAYLASANNYFFDNPIKHNIHAIIKIEPKDKIHNRLKSNIPYFSIIKEGYVDVEVLYFEDIKWERIKNDIDSEYKLLCTTAGLNSLVLRIPIKDIDKLAKKPWLIWMAPSNIPVTTANKRSKSLIKSNMLGSRFYGNLTGKGVRVGEWDAGPVGNHVDYNYRLTVMETAHNVHSHATHVAGTVAGAGIKDPYYTGMATEATMLSWDFYGWVSHEMDTALKYDSIVMTQNSYVYSPPWDTCYKRGYYDYYSHYLDKMVVNYPNLVHVFAAGNSRSQCTSNGYRTISSGFQASKNIVCVGAVNNYDQISGFSSWGPMRDGRLRPDVCAVGVHVKSTLHNNNYSGSWSGTSMATPAVTGIIAQLFEKYRTKYQSEPDASTLKAIVCNTALDKGNPGPDFKYGFGILNGLKAFNAIENGDFVFDSISHNQNYYDTIFIDSSVKKLKILLCWTDKASYPYSPVDSITLVNNLNLLVKDSLGTIFYPLVLDTANKNNTAVQSIDSINNIEQIIINNPIPGKYIINVNGKRIPIGKQSFSLSYENVKEKITVTYPFADESFSPNSSEILRWDAFGQTGSFTLEFSADTGNTWTTIATNINSSRRYFTWTVPNINSAFCKIKISSSNMSGVSDSCFSIMNRPDGFFTTACKEQVFMSWNKVEDANSYDVFKLDSGQWDFQANVSDTFYTFLNLNDTIENWFTVSAVDTYGATSIKANAINVFTDTNIFAPFIIQDISKDTICNGNSKLFVTQATGTQTISKQWQKSTDFGVNWQDISGATDTSLLLTNQSPAENNNVYRIFYQNQCKNRVFSTEAVLTVDTGIHILSLPTNDTVCIGDSVQFDFSVKSNTPMTLQWQKNTNGNTWTNISGENDTFIVLENVQYLQNLNKYRLKISNYCLTDTFSSEVTLCVRKQLSVNINVYDDTICYGKTLVLEANPTGGDSSQYSYLWDDNRNIKIISDTLFSSTTYKINLYDNCSIDTVSDSVYIFVQQPLTVNISVDKDTICYGKTVVLEANPSGGDSSQYSYLWDDNRNTKIINDILFLSKKYKISLYDNCSIDTVRDSVFVFVRQPLTVNAFVDNDTICYGESIEIDATANGGNAQNYNYLLNGNYWNGKSTTFQPTTTTKYLISLFDSCSLQAVFDSVNVFVRPPLELNLLPNKDTTICYGNTVNIKGIAKGGDSANYVFSWNHISGNTANVSVNPKATTKYTLTLDDNCTIPTVNKSITVNVIPKLSVEIISDKDSVCKNGIVNLQAVAYGGLDASYVLEWNNALGSFAQVEDSLSEDKKYVVKLTDGCSVPNAFDTAFVYVRNVNSDWFFNANYLNVSFEAQDKNLKSYFWTLSNGDSSKLRNLNYNFLTAGSYNICLKVSDYADCVAKTNKELYLIPYSIDNENSKNIVVYPNPANGEFFIHFENGIDQNAKLIVYSVGGKEVLIEKKIKKGDKIIPIKLNDYEKGIYLLKVVLENEVYVKKLILNPF